MNLFHAADKSAAGEVGDDRFADFDLFRRPDQRLVGCFAGDAVTSFQDVERAERFEAVCSMRQTAAGRIESLLHRPHCTRLQVVEPLSQVEKPIERFAEDSATTQRVEQFAGTANSTAHLPHQPLSEGVEGGADVTLVRHDDLRSFARRRRGAVGHEVRKGDVDLMADGTDDRNPGTEDGLGDDFFIERPQIFDAAAASTNDDYVDAADPIEATNRGGDLRCRFSSPWTATGHNRISAAGQRRGMI